MLHIYIYDISNLRVNPLNAELNPICHLLALLGVHHFLHVSRIRVNFDMSDGCADMHLCLLDL